MSLVRTAVARALARGARHATRAAALAVAALVLLVASGAQAQPCPMEKPSRRYKVKVDSAPPGAAVYLDRKECGQVGVTPWTGSLAAGNVTILVELDGYEPAQKVLKVARSRKLQEQFVPLVKKDDPPRIEVRADADKNVFDAEVYLDGQHQGRVPVLITSTAGRHQIELRKEGFETLTQWVEVTANQKLTLTPVLKEQAKPKYGVVLVEADIVDGEVYIDGNRHPDQTPTVINNVIEGLHVIEVRKEPALPWKQTIQVVAGQQVKVRAELKATLGGGGGNLRVLSNVDGAKVFVDGTEMGVVPLDVKDVKPGEHIIELRAPGYQVRREKVVTNNGQAQIFSFDLNPEAGAADEGTIKVVSPVPDADVFIDGASVGKVPQDKKIASGEHFVVVKLAGFKDFEQKVRVEPGQVITVSAELKAVGRLRVLSTPEGAEVVVNGVPMGKTPLLDAEVEVGETVLRITAPGFRSIERTITIEGGKVETVSAELEVSGPTETEMLAEQRGLSHFGARTLGRGRATVDLGLGYPWLGEVRINVGAGRLKNFGLDAGVGIRTMLARNDIGLGARIMLVDHEPFSAGAFGNLWWGSKLLDESKRNGVTAQAGVLASLTALSNVTITGRAYLDIWSDRHCPEVKNGVFDGEPIAACAGYKARRIDGMNPADFSETDAVRLEELTGQSGADMFSRDGGTRFMMSVIAEVALRQRWSLYGLFEGTFQDERALYTHLLSGPMFTTDPGTYLRLGAIYKF